MIAPSVREHTKDPGDTPKTHYQQIFPLFSLAVPHRYIEHCNRFKINAVRDDPAGFPHLKTGRTPPTDTCTYQPVL